MAYELTELEKKHVLQSSIERVINTSIGLADKLMLKDEDAGINRDDWLELKWIVCKLWDRERDTIYREQLAAKK